MASRRIKIRNLIEENNLVEKTVHVKPTILLVIAMAVGGILITLRGYYLILGVALVLLALFGIIVMPDRILCQFTKDYLILYNYINKEECTMIPWDEIVSWKYEYHYNYDTLVLDLVDDTTERQEMYSKRSIKKYMQIYAPDKEVKNVRIKKGKV